jgi:AraC family transcriptional regulator
MDRAALIRALTYVQANLDSDLSLETVAAVANCTAPYFNRRFHELMAETPKQYTSRLRLERAALRLVLLNETILNIALDCGFANHETFCRAFRRHHDVTPTAFRAAGRLSRTSAHESPQHVTAATPSLLSRTVVRTVQPMSLAFIRHTGPYEQVPVNGWDPLVDWARRRRLPEPYVRLGIAQDAPGITPAEKLRFDVAIRVPAQFRSEKLVGCQAFSGGLFALTTNVGPFATLPSAYAEIFKRLRADRSLDCLGVPCLEFYRLNPAPADIAIVHTEIAVPIKRLTKTQA